MAGDISQFLTSAGAVVGCLVALPVLYACVRAGMFFGRAEQNIQALRDSVSTIETTLEEHMEYTTHLLAQHETRITVIEKTAGIA